MSASISDHVVLFPTPPPTSNALSAAQRTRLVRSSKKIGKILGFTPHFLDQQQHVDHVDDLLKLKGPLEDIFLPTTRLSIDSDDSSRSLSRAGSLRSSTSLPHSAHVNDTWPGRKPPMLRLALSSSPLDSIPASPISPRSSIPSRSPLDGSPSPSPTSSSSSNTLITTNTRTETLQPSPTAPTFTIPTPSSLRRIKMDRVRRKLGEDVPVGLVFPPPPSQDTDGEEEEENENDDSSSCVDLPPTLSPSSSSSSESSEDDSLVTPTDTTPPIFLLPPPSEDNTSSCLGTKADGKSGEQDRARANEAVGIVVGEEERGRKTPTGAALLVVEDGITLPRIRGNALRKEDKEQGRKLKQKKKIANARDSMDVLLASQHQVDVGLSFITPPTPLAKKEPEVHIPPLPPPTRMSSRRVSASASASASSRMVYPVASRPAPPPPPGSPGSSPSPPPSPTKVRFRKVQQELGVLKKTMNKKEKKKMHLEGEDSSSSFVSLSSSTRRSCSNNPFCTGSGSCYCCATGKRSKTTAPPSTPPPRRRSVVRFGSSSSSSPPRSPSSPCSSSSSSGSFSGSYSGSRSLLHAIPEERESEWFDNLGDGDGDDNDNVGFGWDLDLDFDFITQEEVLEATMLLSCLPPGLEYTARSSKKEREAVEWGGGTRAYGHGMGRGLARSYGREGY